MVTLSQLILDGTAVVELPRSLGSLTGLLTLSLNRCRNLICLPNSLGKLKSLTDLSIMSIMGCLQISKLPYNLGENEALQYLNALETTIRELPSSIVHLKSLKCLYVQVLPELPPSFSSLCSLISLSLWCCSMRDGAFPQNLECLSSLEKLDLSFSNVERLPCLSGLLKLRNVYLDFCQNLLSFHKLPTNVVYFKAICCNDLVEISFHPLTWNVLFPNDFEEDDRRWLGTITSKCRNEDFQSSNNKEQFNGKDITTSDVRQPVAESFIESMLLSFCSNIRGLNLRGCGLSNERIPQYLGFFSLLEWLHLGDNDFVNLPNDCISKLFKLGTLWLDNCQGLKSLPSLPPNLEYVCLENCQSLKSLPNLPPKLKNLILNKCRSLESLPNLPPYVECVFLDDCQSLKSLPMLPPNVTYVTASNCISMRPPPVQYQQQILGLLAASMESETKEGLLEFQEVFCVAGSEIPQWFDNQNYCVPNKPFSEEEDFDAIFEDFDEISEDFDPMSEDFGAISITVDITDNCYKSECWGIAVCLVIQGALAPSYIIDDGCVRYRIRAIESPEGPHLLIVHYRAQNRQFDQSKIQLTLDFKPPLFREAPCGWHKIEKWGYRVFSKEDAHAWRKTMTS